MIPRYSRPEMTSIWSEQSKFQIWYEIEAHACDAMAELGMIPQEAAKAVGDRGGFDIDRINEIEHETKHDVIAFLTSLAEHASVPVINALTERSHPCQILADLQTMIERHGTLDGQIVTWVGDGNNVTTSWIEASARFGFQLRIACPQVYSPSAELLAWARGEGADIVLYDNAEEAVTDSQTVVTDVWISMGDDEGSRATDFQPFQVNADLMKRAAGDAIFMHCLPAWRGMEVTADVIDGPQSAVFDEAENRLHAQKAVLSWCVAGN